jgi:hypothetical protein
MGTVGWDCFHYEAFRQPSIDYIAGQRSACGKGSSVPREGFDDYASFLSKGSAGFRTRSWLEASACRIGTKMPGLINSSGYGDAVDIAVCSSLRFTMYGRSTNSAIIGSGSSQEKTDSILVLRIERKKEAGRR